MTKPAVMGVIPARLDSTRLPGKVLRDVAGVPMLHRVYANARQAHTLTTLIVATDSPQVVQSCQQAGIPVTLTGQHASGGDRVHEVLTRTDAQFYVNLQGDEPTLMPEQINLLVQTLLERPDAQVATLKTPLHNRDAADPNTVKVVTGTDGRALFFSRCPIPYDRDGTGTAYFKHIGVYGYTRAALQRFHSLPRSPLEVAESLEQLRFLENNLPIFVAETPHDTVGVDTEADLQRVIALFQTGA